MISISKYAIILFLVKSSVEWADHRITDLNGTKLPIYEHLFYSISSFHDRRSMMFNPAKHLDKILAPELEQSNQYHWWRFTVMNETSHKYKFCLATNDCSRGFVTNNQLTPTGRTFNIKSDVKNDKGELMFMSNFRSLNGDYFHFGNCEHCKGTQDFEKWLIEIYPDYQLYGLMNDFVYEVPNKDVLNKHLKRVNLLDTSLISGNFTEQVTSDFTKSISKKELYMIHLADNVNKFTQFQINATIDGQLFGFGDVDGDNIKEYTWNSINNPASFNGNNIRINRNIDYKIDKRVNVPANSKIHVSSYVNWLDSLEMWFTAKLTVTGKGPKFLKDNTMDASALKSLLSHNQLLANEELIAEKENSLIFNVRGIFLGSIGLNDVYQEIDLNKNYTYFYEVETK